MKLYIKQGIFSFNTFFNVFDENKNIKYNVQGKLFSLGEKFTIYNKNGEEKAYIT